MEKSIRNIILICAMAAVSVMGVGLSLYEYIPNGLTVTKANQYEVDEKTTELLGDAQKAQELLTAQTKSKTSESASTSKVKTNIVLKEYDVSKTDLAMYKQSGSYKSGRANPFDDVTAEPVQNNGTTSDGTTTDSITENNSKNVQTEPDGTFYNSTRKK